MDQRNVFVVDQQNVFVVSHFNYANLLKKLERYDEAEEHYGLLDRAAQEGAGAQPSLC
mgnify:CR=1 FL=1